MQILKTVIIAIVFFTSISAQNLKIFLEQKYVMGADENCPTEYFFNDPTGICADMIDDIYKYRLTTIKIPVF